MLEEEDVLEYSGAPSELPAFIKEVISIYAKNELAIKDESDV